MDHPVPEESAVPDMAATGAGNPLSTPRVPVSQIAIPDHELIRRIGAGSYGDVWLARNVMGTFRAVKIVQRKTFLSDRPYEREFGGIQNFEPVSRSQENQVNILHIGREEDCFFYVMELADDQVTGPAIDPQHYVPRTLKSEKDNRKRLPFEECLEIGLALSAALAHLHKSGLVHRDVKPSNVIYVNGIIKLADIGLVTDMDATVSFVGTEGFIPPEGPGTPQADLYSLGKVLYEISTGKDRLDYPEPPTLLGEFPDREQLLELGEIIKKACAPKPGDRYQNADTMQSDLLLLKTGRSIRRTHQLERRLKITRRVAIAVVAVMIFGVVPYYLAIKEARVASTTAKREAEQRQRAEANELKAKTEANKSIQVARFLARMLEGVGPSKALGRDTTILREILDKSAADVEHNLENEPEVQAELYLVIGKTYEELGQYTNAVWLTREAVRLRKAQSVSETPELADSLANLGAMLYSSDDFKGAEEMGRQALEMRRRLYGDEHTNVATSLNNIGLALWNQNKTKEAESMEREALRMRKKLLGNNDIDVAKTFLNLANVQYLNGDFAGAEENFSESLRILRQRLTPEHPYLAVVQNNLATLLSKKGEYAAAAEMYSATLEMRKKTLKEHPFVAYSMTQLAIALTANGELERAKGLLEEALAMEGKLLPRESEDVANTLAALGVVLAKKGDWLGAQTNQQEALAIRLKLLGSNNPDVTDSLDAISLLSIFRGDLGDAEQILKRALAIDDATPQGSHLNAVPVLEHLAWILEQKGDSTGSTAWREKAVTFRSLHGDYSETPWSEGIYDLAYILCAGNKFAQAESLLLRVAEHFQKSPGVSLSLRRRCNEQMVRFYEAWDKAEPNSGKKAKASEWNGIR